MFLRIVFCILLALGPLCGVESKEPQTVIVLFGATGDLASKKIMPALSRLARGGEDFTVIGVGRRDFSQDTFRDYFPGIDPVLKERLFYSRVDLDKSESYANLKASIEEVEKKTGAKTNRLFYLSTQASYFSSIVKELGKQNLLYPTNQREWSRILIEKPYGHNLASALELQKELEKTLDESQIYRVDHYLAKPGVDGLRAFREEGKFEPKWNGQHIDHVQISLSEEIGIGNRAQFWEETGLVRDVFQNHLLQLLALTAADPGAKANLFDVVRPVKIIRGQYRGYQEEPGVSKTSQVETFAAAKFSIENEKWKGVPFYIRAGKRMASQTVQIAVVFKDGNHLIFRIQPEPAIYYKGEKIADFQGHEAYDVLIGDAIQGEKSRFVPKEEAFASWRIVAPFLEAEISPTIYSSGSNGPSEADSLLKEDGREWVNQVF